MLACCSCTQQVDLGTNDAGPPPQGVLALSGRVCPPVPDPLGFPVKVVAVVQTSGSMCVADPPGDNGGSFCNQIVDDGQIVRRQIPDDVRIMLEEAQVHSRRVIVIKLAENPRIHQFTNLPNRAIKEKRVVDHDAEVLPCGEID